MRAIVQGEDVEVELEDDFVSHMQMPIGWTGLLAELQLSLAMARAAEWLVEWLSHCCTNWAEGMLLGHMGGNVR